MRKLHEIVADLFRAMYELSIAHRGYTELTTRSEAQHLLQIMDTHNVVAHGTSSHANRRDREDARKRAEDVRKRILQIEDRIGELIHELVELPEPASTA